MLDRIGTRISHDDGNRTSRFLGLAGCSSTYGENEVFGERSALTARVHGASATADTDCKLLRLDQDLLYEVMASNPEVSRGIIKVLLERFQ